MSCATENDTPTSPSEKPARRSEARIHGRGLEKSLDNWNKSRTVWNEVCGGIGKSAIHFADTPFHRGTTFGYRLVVGMARYS